MPNPYKDFLDKAREQGYTDEEIRAALSRGGWKDEDATKVLTSKDSAAPILGNFLDQIGSNVSSGVQGVKSLWDAITGPKESFPSQNTLRTVGSVLKGAATGPLQQQQQAAQEIKGGHPIYGTLRNIVGGQLPMAGPDAMNIIDQLMGRGSHAVEGPNPGGALGNAATMAAQYGGPEIMKALGTPERALGDVLYQGRSGGKGAFDFDKETSIPDRKAITAMGKQLGIKVAGKEGLKGIDFLGDTTKPDTFLGQQEAGLQKALAPVRNKNVNLNTVLQPLQEEIAGIDETASPGAAARKAGLVAKLQEFKAQHGWEPAKSEVKESGVLDKDGKPIRSIINTPEKPMNPITAGDAQDFKRTLYRLNSPSLYSDTAPLPAVDKASNVLLAKGYKNAIDEVAPEGKPFNENMHRAIGLQDQLIDAEKTYPGFLKNWSHWLVGAGGIGLGIETAAAGVGHPMMGLPFLAGSIASKAVSDPLVASRVGLALSHAGTDPISLSLGLAPITGRTGQLVPPQAQPNNPQQPQQ